MTIYYSGQDWKLMRWVNNYTATLVWNKDTKVVIYILY